MTGNIINKKGKNLALYRIYTANSDLSSTEYLAPTKFKIGVNNVEPLETDTDLTNPIPLSNGTINDDGSNQLTGSNGGDNTTDNTTTYKQGAGLTDNTSQNLKVNNTSATKTFTISDLSVNGTVINKDYYVGLFIYIKDSTTLDYFKSTGTAVEIKLGSDSSNYYSKTFEKSDLSTGWNWLYLGKLSDNTETGTVGTTIDTFIIEITTNNATDVWAEGDVIYDLLRSWQYSDTVDGFVSGYPSFDYTNNEVTIRCYIDSVTANGFFIDSVALVTEDTNPIMHSEAVITGESKSDTDEFAFVIKDRVR